MSRVEITDGSTFAKRMPFYPEFGGEIEYWVCGVSHSGKNMDYQWGWLHLNVVSRVMLAGYQDRVFYEPIYENPEGEKSMGKLRCVALSTFKKYLKPHRLTAALNPNKGGSNDEL